MIENNSNIKNYKRAKFIKKLRIPQGEKINLKILISIDNEREQGDYLEAFIRLVNVHKSRIKSVEFVIGGYLKRYYIGEEAALKLFENWEKENAKYIKLLDSSVEIKLTDWKNIIESKEFILKKEIINENYKTDNAFITLINQISKTHAHKANLEKAREYLLEETAFFSILEGHVCYPSTNLNGSNQYVKDNYNEKGFFFHGYAVLDVKHKENCVKKDESSNAHDYRKYTEINFGELLQKFGININNLEKVKQAVENLRSLSNL